MAADEVMDSLIVNQLHVGTFVGSAGVASDGYITIRSATGVVYKAMVYASA